jgi:putative transposase
VQEQLQAMERSRSVPQALAQRARIILLAADGLNNGSVAARLGLSRSTVGKWRQRFLRQGLVGLYDAAKPGGPRSISDDQVASLIRRTLKTKPKSLGYLP